MPRRPSLPPGLRVVSRPFYDRSNRAWCVEAEDSRGRRAAIRLNHLYNTAEENPKEVPAFIDPGEVEAYAKAKEAYKFFAKVFHPDYAISGREAKGLRPLNEGLFNHVAAFKRASSAWQDVNEGAGGRDRLRMARGIRILNTMLQPWHGSVRHPYPHISSGGEQIELELPEGYIARSDARLGGVHKAAKSAEKDPAFVDQERRLALLLAAAQYWLQKKYGVIWGKLRPDLKQSRKLETVGNWTTTYGIPWGLVRQTPTGRSFYTDGFDALGLTPSTVRRAATWSTAGYDFMETMEVSAGVTTRANITADRQAAGKTAAAQQVRAEDLWTTTPQTPEEELAYSRGETEEAFRRSKTSALSEMLSRMEAEGPAGRTKVAIIKMHLGEEVVPGQPDRLLGRVDAKGRRHAQTSRAYQDLSGEVWRLNKRSQLVQRKRATKYHPVRPGEKCPTCTAIARFFRVRGMGPAEVSAVIDDFGSAPLAGDR